MAKMPVAAASGSRNRSMRQLQQTRRGSVRNLFDSADDRLARQMESLKRKSSRRLVVEDEPEESETTNSGSNVMLDRRQMFATSRKSGRGAGMTLPEPVVEEESNLSLTKSQTPVKDHARQKVSMTRRDSISRRSSMSNSSTSLRDLSGIAGLPPLKGIPDMEACSDLDESEFSLGEELASFRSVLSETMAQLDHSLSGHNNADGIGIHFRSRRHVPKSSRRSEQPSFHSSTTISNNSSAKKKATDKAKRKRAIGRRLTERTAGDALFRVDPKDKEIAPGKPPVAKLSINYKYPFQVVSKKVTQKVKEIGDQ